MATKGISSRTLRKLPTNMQVKLSQAAVRSRTRATATTASPKTNSSVPGVSTPQSRDAQIKAAFNYNLSEFIGYDQVAAVDQELKNSVYRAVDDSTKTDNAQTTSFDIANGSTTFYPGKLVRVDKTNFLKAGPQNLAVGANQRAPMTFRIIAGGRQKAGLNLDVSNNTETEVNDFIVNKIGEFFKENNNQPLPVSTNLAFDGKEIFSKEHLDTKVTCKIDAFGVDASVSTDTTTTKNYVLYKIVQSYYTAHYDGSNISTPSKVFNLDQVDDDMIAVLNDCKTKNTPVAYISEVTYGRVILMMLSSTLSVEKIKASLKVNKAGVDVNADANSEKENKQIEIKVVAFGGGIGAATDLCAGTLKDFTTDKSYIDSINNLLKDNQFTSPYYAVPISYKLKFLKDNSDVVLNNSFKDVDVEDDIKIKFNAGHLGVVVNVYTRYMAPVMQNGKLVWTAFTGQNKKTLNAWGDASLVIPARARFVQISVSPQVRGRKYTVILDRLPLKGSMYNSDSGYHECKIQISGDTAQSFSVTPDASSLNFNQDYSLYEDKKCDGIFRNIGAITSTEATKAGFFNVENYVAFLANQDFNKFSDKVSGLHQFYSSDYIRDEDAKEKKAATGK